MTVALAAAGVLVLLLVALALIFRLPAGTEPAPRATDDVHPPAPAPHGRGRT